MWEGDNAKFESSGYYFHLEPANLMLGVGIHIFSKDILQAYWNAVVDPDSGPTLVKAIQEVCLKKGYNLGGKHYKRVPRSYDPDHENVELLLYKGLTAGYEQPVPEEFYSEELLDYCYQKYVDMYLIKHWLFELTESDLVN